MPACVRVYVCEIRAVDERYEKDVTGVSLTSVGFCLRLPCSQNVKLGHYSFVVPCAPDVFETLRTYAIYWRRSASTTNGRLLT